MPSGDRKAMHELIRGRWWRASCYEFTEGRITPATGSSGAWFDPWAQYELVQRRTIRHDGAKTAVARPYLSLVNLIDRLQSTTPDEPLPLDDESRMRVLEWCSRNGLLGILLQEVREAVLPDPTRRYGFARLIRAHDGWLERPVRPRRVFGTARKSSTGNVMRSECTIYSEPIVFRAPLGTDGTEAEPLTQTWNRFFPDHVDRVSLPGTDDFWGRYGEPIQRFLDAGEMFSRVVRTLAQSETPPADPEATPPADPEDDERDRDDESDERDRARALRTLNALSSTVVQVAHARHDGDYAYHWTSPSLLASYAQMLKQDIVSYRLVSCAACDHIWVARSAKAKYCSDACSWRGQKRAQRQRTPDDKTGE